MKVTEKSFPLEESSRLLALSDEVLRELELPQADSLPLAIDQAVYEWQKNGTPPKSAAPDIDADDILYAFGIAWGDAVVKKHGWHWANLTFHELDNWEATAIVSPDASLMILLFAHIRACIDGEEEVKIGAALNVIGSDVIPPLEDKSYTNLTENIQRIIPRT